jgi:hypothetical protein
MRRLLGLTLLAACAPARVPAPAPEPPPVSPAPAVASVSPAVAADSGSAAAALAPPPAVHVLDFRRVLDARVHSLALGEAPRVAALGGDAWLDTGKGFAVMPKPPRATADVAIFFGRDNAPRLMGFERGDGGDLSVYLRWQKGGWQRGASEIGRLAGAKGALYGVLGDADPEVVCKVGEVCIIKRRTGWTTIDAPPGRPHVVLSGSVPIAFDGSQVLRLEKDGFRSLGEGLPFAHADALVALGDAELWVAERRDGALHHLSAGKWSRDASPISGPRALWASGAADVWLVGDGGVAHHDGQRWSRVEGVKGALEVVTGRSESEVWLAGASGVWRGSR